MDNTTKMVLETLCDIIKSQKEEIEYLKHVILVNAETKIEPEEVERRYRLLNIEEEK